MKKLLLIAYLFILCSVSDASDHFILPVKFFPSEGYQCGPASLAMVLNFLGVNITPEEISNEIYSKDAKGTWEIDMLLFVKKLGFEALHYRGNMEDIKTKIKSGKPLIVMVDEGFWFYRKYHYMVVVGFNDSEIIVNSERNERKALTIEKFLDKWRKTDFWTLYIYKEDKNGSS